MKKGHKDAINTLRERANVLRQCVHFLTPELLSDGIQFGLAVEATNIAFGFEKLIKEIDNG
jgi:hypothetical protein